MREKITLMPLNQIRMILQLLDAPNQRLVVSGRSEGAIIKELYRKGYVKPTGKIGRAIRWELITTFISEADIDLMRELAKNH